VISVYCILQKKSQTAYCHNKQIFSIILKKCQDRDLYSDPIFLHSDFELAVINAAKNIFGTHTTINGCFYHFCQLTHRKFRNLVGWEFIKNIIIFENIAACLMD